MAALAFCVASVGYLTRAAAQEAEQPVAIADGAPEAFGITRDENVTTTPDDVGGMLQLESRIREVVLKAVPATVGVQVNGGQGSGVIISPDGYVLTAAHVSGRPGRGAFVILSDGRRLQAQTLGRNRSLDASVMRIIDPNAGELPYAELGRSVDLDIGTWTVATGHPGGYQEGRPPVVRVGRVNANTPELLQTDNTLVGGDSGGPLFDVNGRVIGIHSRIGDSLARNVHVPVDVYLAGWDEMAGGEDFGGNQFLRGLRERFNNGDDGIRLDLSEDGGKPRDEQADGGAVVLSLEPTGPAAKAGIQEGDRILRVGEFEIESSEELFLRRMTLKPDVETTYMVMRDGEELQFNVTPVRSVALRPEWERRQEWLDYPSRGAVGIGQFFAAEPSGLGFGYVEPGSPADEAGLKAGDIIVGMGNRIVRNDNDLLNILRP
ncbi:MAG: trypsin-like peptidase domain-containing protein, partial [Planctomycetota bacterium]